MNNTNEFNFDSYNAFFAFGQEQYNKQAIPWTDYVQLEALAWIIVPRDKAKQLMEDYTKYNEDKILDRIQTQGLESIIEYELNNYECYYIGSIHDAIPRLHTYWATTEQIYDIYMKTKHKYE